MVKKTIKFDIYIKTSEQTPTYSYTAKQKVMSNDKDSTQITFNLLDVAPEELSGSSASILLYMEDGSFFQKSDVTINRNSVIYTMKPEETRHSGNTKVQIVLNKGTVQTASLIYNFEIERGLEKFPIVEKEIQDWTSLTAEAKAFVEQIKDFTLEGFVENKMGEELANLETNYATRLTGLEQKDNQLTAQLAQTATKSEVESKIGELGAVATFKGSATNAVILAKSGMAIGDEWYDTTNQQSLRWNGTGWIPVGGAIKLSDGSVTPEKIDGVSGESLNILNLDLVSGGIYWTGTTSPITLGTAIRRVSGANWHSMDVPIKVKAGDVLRWNKAFQDGYAVGTDENGIITQIAPTKSVVGDATLTVNAQTTIIYTNIYKPIVEEAMITLNQAMPTSYQPYNPRRVIEWLNLKSKSVELGNLAEDVLAKINFSKNEYFGTNGVIAGDSIIDNVGENPTGLEVLLGYDGVLIRELGLNSLQNVGVSGRPMANGTAHGVGTCETVMSSGINWNTKKFFICNSGTNDFKLNVEIGESMPFKSTFNQNTYFGAYQKMIEYVRTQNPDIIIIILTPAQRNHSGYTTETVNSAGHKLIDYVNAGVLIAEKYSALLVDIYRDSGITELNINNDTYDGLHFNNSGYEKGGICVVKKMIYG